MINFAPPEGAYEEDGGVNEEQLSAFVVAPDILKKVSPDVFNKLQKLVGPGALIITEQQKELQRMIMIIADASGSDIGEYFQYPER